MSELMGFGTFFGAVEILDFDSSDPLKSCGGECQFCHGLALGAHTSPPSLQIKSKNIFLNHIHF